MDSFEITKIAGGVLCALLVIVGFKTALRNRRRTHSREAGLHAAHAGGARRQGTGAAVRCARGHAGQHRRVQPGRGRERMPQPPTPRMARQCSRGASVPHEREGGANKVGPNLWGIVGRPKASHAGFPYSDAMKAKGGNWTPEDLAAFVHDPKGFVPGTKMIFPGIADPSRAGRSAGLSRHPQVGAEQAAPRQNDSELTRASARILRRCGQTRDTCRPRPGRRWPARFPASVPAGLPVRLTHVTGRNQPGASASCAPRPSARRRRRVAVAALAARAQTESPAAAPAATPGATPPASRPRGHSAKAPPCAVARRRAQVSARLQAFRLGQPGCAQGRHASRHACEGTFDSLNPFPVQGVPAASLGLIYDSLMATSPDEPSTEYGLIAEWVSYPDRLLLGDVRAAPAGALPRRHADHARGRRSSASKRSRRRTRTTPSTTRTSSRPRRPASTR